MSRFVQDTDTSYPKSKKLKFVNEEEDLKYLAYLLPSFSHETGAVLLLIDHHHHHHSS